jgi:serine phosphatase RsbU (regulator of sigma subunit)
LLRQPDGTTVFLEDACDPPLGAAESFRRYEVVLQPGAVLVLYTDGLVERRTESISRGLQRLEQACRRGPTSPEGLCDHLLDVMFRDALNEDDVALVIVALG